MLLPFRGFRYKTASRMVWTAFDRSESDQQFPGFLLATGVRRVSLHNAPRPNHPELLQLSNCEIR